jgi:hypothetical protein
VNEVEPQLEDTLVGATLIPGSPRGPGFSAPRETASNGVGSASGSFDIVDLGASELGLSGCPEHRSCPPAGSKLWGGGGAELMFSWVATTCRLLTEKLAMVVRDVQQLVRVSPKTEIRDFLLDFPRPSLGSLTPFLF